MPFHASVLKYSKLEENALWRSFSSAFSNQRRSYADMMLSRFPSHDVLDGSRSPKFDRKVLLTCEHASAEFPTDYRLPDQDSWLHGTHWSYDLGSRDFTMELCQELGATALIHKASRLIVDPNRPTKPYSPTLFRDTAEHKPIYFNKDLSNEEKEKRIKEYHLPYHNELRNLVKLLRPSLILSLHSFTPLYEGNIREVEVGVLYNKQESLANELNSHLRGCGYDSRINEPWSGLKGFMYAAASVETQEMKGIMLEFRQDLAVQKEWRTIMIQHLVTFLSKKFSLSSV